MRNEVLCGRLVRALLVVALLAAGPAAPARAQDASQAGTDAGLGLATVLANAIYAPVKVTYAVLGGATGGFAFLLTGGNEHVANQIWIPSVGGDYVLSPEMVSGHEAIRFSGPRDVPEAEPAVEESVADFDDAGF